MSGQDKGEPEVGPDGWPLEWEDFMSGGEWISLKEDGESVEFVPLRAPEFVTVESGRFGARRVARIQCLTPCDSSGRIAFLDLGPRAARRYAPVVRGRERKVLVEMTRIGRTGAQETTYRFSIIRKLDAGEVELVVARCTELDA